jgi:hypothetical protein
MCIQQVWWVRRSIFTCCACESDISRAFKAKTTDMSIASVSAHDICNEHVCSMHKRSCDRYKLGGECTLLMPNSNLVDSWLPKAGDLL